MSVYVRTTTTAWLIKLEEVGTVLVCFAGAVNMDEGKREHNPSEDKITAFQRKQEKREKLSSLMGQYLLKGYRMLGTNCSECGVRWNERGIADNCLLSESQDSKGKVNS